ncbi:5826_t:CDS:1, partial [Gigaspora rosea]
VTNSITQNDLSNDDSSSNEDGDNSTDQLLSNIPISLSRPASTSFKSPTAVTSSNAICTIRTFSKFTTAITSSDTCQPGKRANVIPPIPAHPGFRSMHLL